MDKTEARYAEVARIMAETNSWITPQIDYGIPFWAKPPLSTWLSAMSFEVFGVNEFAARLPYLLLAIVLVFLTGKYAKREHLPFFLPGFILLTLPEFLLHAGVVSTDTTLAFSIALVMLSFWEMFQNNAKFYWKYLVFVGFGLGFLAKGPIVVILTLPPIVIWVLLCENYKTIFKRIPWIVGIIITIAVALPWYILAEQRTPGFIDYFVVGEHFKRFFDSSWADDKYGFPKSQPLGMIWIFLLLFALPWIQVLLLKLWKNRTSLTKNKWVVFLLLWLLWTPLFFTISKSLIHPYIMPVMVPLALLITHWWKSIKQQKALIRLSLFVPVLIIGVYAYGSISKQLQFYSNTDKYFIEKTNTQFDNIYHLGSKSYSSQFYSKGKIKKMTIGGLEEKIRKKEESFIIIIKNRDFKRIPFEQRNCLKPLDKNNNKRIYKYARY
ncbi:ArnT family glycosyltransferase [Maribacter ulvicola]|nr:glycosyltransferase family 39 protein [Maribacter ulvicola]